MSIIKIDFSRIVGTSKDVKPRLPLFADRGVIFFERDTKVEYYWTGAEWELYAKSWNDYAHKFTDLEDTPSTIEDGKVPMGTSEGTIIWTTPATADPSTGFEKVDDGNGPGLRITGQDPSLYNNMAVGAVDMQFVYPDDLIVYGTESPYSLLSGRQNVITSSASGLYAIGVGNRIDTGDNDINSGAIGAYNTIVSGRHNHLIGAYHQIASSDRGSSLLAGNNNRASNGSGMVGLGMALDVRANSMVAVGVSNVAWGGNISDADRPIFVVGIGEIDYDPADGFPTASSRADGLSVRKNGVVYYPSLSTSLIDAESNTSKVALTKEWYIANVPDAQPTPTLDSVAKAGPNSTVNISAPNLVTNEVDVYSLDSISGIITCTQAEYNSLTPANAIMYIIIG